MGVEASVELLIIVAMLLCCGEGRRVLRGVRCS